MPKDSTSNPPPRTSDESEDPKQSGSIPTSPISRRVFVAAGSGMLLAAGVEACDSEGTRSLKGAVRLILTGLDASATSGGTARISRVPGGPTITFEIPVIGEATIAADIGDYSLEYTPPTGYQVLQTGPRSIAVDLDATTTVAINVVAEASVGAIQVVVTGLTGAAGGTAVAQRTDAAAAPRVIPVPASGTALGTAIPVGVYSVSYTPPTGFLDASAANPVAGLSVATGATATAGFAVSVAPGSIRVVVTGIAGATLGGQVSAIRTDNTGNTFTIDLETPTSGQSTGDITNVPAGNYNVTYTPPSGYQLAAGSANPQVVSVAAGGTGNVTFAGQVIPGSVQITVTGLSGALGGGQVSARRTDNTGSTFSASLPAPTSGSSTGSIAGLPPGDYNVSYAPPVGYQLASQSPQIVAVVSGAQASASFAVVAATGTLRMIVEGVAVGAPDAGSAQVQRTDIAGQTPIAVTVPASGSVDTSLQPGTYSITFSPPSGYQLAAGQTNPRSVTVTGTQTVITTFQVAQALAAGTLRLTITGLDPAGANGGSAQVLRTDIAGQSPLTVNVPASGTVDTPLQPGTYSVTYTPPGGRRLVAGQTNPQSMVITASGLGTVSFQTEVAPQSAFIFTADWSTALGNTTAAITDGGRFDIRGGSGGAVVTTASTGANFPTANVLYVPSRIGEGSCLPRKSTGLGVPAIGESRFYRIYLLFAFDDNDSDPQSHPVQDGNAGGDINWEIAIRHNDAGPGFVLAQFQFGSENAFPWMKVNGPALPKNQVFRWEWQILRTGTNTFQCHARIYNAAGTLLYDDDDFRNEQATGNLTSNHEFNFHVLANMAGLNVGANQGNYTPAGFYGYQGAVAVSAVDWCGPYVAGESP